MINGMDQLQYCIVSYCMHNYKPNRLAPHGPPDTSQTIALDLV